VRLDLIAVDPVRAAVRDVKERLVRGQANAVCEVETLVHLVRLALRTDVPDHAPARRGERVGGVNRSVVTDDEVIAPESARELGRSALRVPGEDLLNGPGIRVEPAVGPEGLPVAPLRVREKHDRLPVGPDLVRLARADVVEEHLAGRIDGRPFREPKTLADEFPALAGDQDFLELRR